MYDVYKGEKITYFYKIILYKVSKSVKKVGIVFNKNNSNVNHSR